MKETEKISIIVPVYNVEKYLSECLDSIKGQTLRNWECILVDDGSTDSSGQICDVYAKEDNRFRVIHKKNGGVSSARNEALKVIDGRYVAFVDSDDSVKPEFLKVMHDLITEYDADAVQVGMEIQYSAFTKKRSFVEARKCINHPDLVRCLMEDEDLPSYLWNKMFKREVIDAPFPEGMTYEDIYVMTEWSKNIGKMVLSPENLYIYRQRSGSIANSKYVENRLNYLKMKMHRAEALRRLEPEVVKDSLFERCTWLSLITSGKIIARNEDDEKKRTEGIRRIQHIASNGPRPTLKNLGLKKWLRSQMLLWAPSCFMFSVRVSNIISHKKSRNKSYIFN